MSEDPELTALAMQLSNYAFKMVEEQHKLALGLNASYDIEVDDMRTTLTILQLGKHTTVMRGSVRVTVFSGRRVFYHADTSCSFAVKQTTRQWFRR
ncbi:hypothetical protein GN958_ATG15832 [Phytophthora infestans]|uniref:Uncharacterized protein n=1 Tax=Phytophthora infestans TaxID=4787 RepID=A0A8S9U1K1_PHYIN|nr:hypothetical protein GN958_ATG15832 [Phytophthora infestans]